MKGLAGLRRLANWRVEEQQRRVAALEASRERIGAERDVLLAALARERAGAGGIESGLRDFSPYLRRVRVEEERLRRAEERLEQAVREARDGLAERFADAKRYDIIAERIARQGRAEQQRRERRLLDEVALTRFRRQQG